MNNNDQEAQVVGAFIQGLAAAPDAAKQIINAVSQMEGGQELLTQIVKAGQSAKKSKSQMPSYNKQGGVLNTPIFAKGGMCPTCQKFQFPADPLPKFNRDAYNVIINAPGDTTYTKPYKYLTETRQTYPDGSVRISSYTGSDDFHYWDPTAAKPSFFRRLWFGNKTAPQEKLANWRELMFNHRNDTNVKDKTK